MSGDCQSSDLSCKRLTVSRRSDHRSPQCEIDETHPLHLPPSHLGPFLAGELEGVFTHLETVVLGRCRLPKSRSGTSQNPSILRVGDLQWSGGDGRYLNIRTSPVVSKFYKMAHISRQNRIN